MSGITDETCCHEFHRWLLLMLCIATKSSYGKEEDDDDEEEELPPELPPELEAAQQMKRSELDIAIIARHCS